MTDERTDVDYFVLLAGISSCCEEGFRQGVHFMQTNIIPQKERLAKIEVLEEMKKELDEAGSDCFYTSENLEYHINKLKAGNC